MDVLNDIRPTRLFQQRNLSDGSTRDTLIISILAAAISAGTAILFACLGEIMCERAGVLNLGVEGMMLMGALSGFAVTFLTGNPVLFRFINNSIRPYTQKSGPAPESDERKSGLGTFSNFLESLIVVHDSMEWITDVLMESRGWRELADL